MKIDDDLSNMRANIIMTEEMMIALLFAYRGPPLVPHCFTRARKIENRITPRTKYEYGFGSLPSSIQFITMLDSLCQF